MSKLNRKSWKLSVAASVAWLLPLIIAGFARGQVLRAPDLGIWLSRQTSADGTHSLVVADLIADGVFARSGLLEGDRIMSIDGRRIDREAEFVQTFLLAGNHIVNLMVERNGQQQTITLKASAVMGNTVRADPLYQAGLLIDQGKPE